MEGLPSRVVASGPGSHQLVSVITLALLDIRISREGWLRVGTEMSGALKRILGGRISWDSRGSGRDEPFFIMIHQKGLRVVGIHSLVAIWLIEGEVITARRVHSHVSPYADFGELSEDCFWGNSSRNHV